MVIQLIINNRQNHRWKLEGRDSKNDTFFDRILDEILTGLNNGNTNIIADRMVLMIEVLKIQIRF